MAQRHYPREFYRRWDKAACPVCNLTYCEELAEDRQYHRKFHSRVVLAFEPKPNVTIAMAYARDGQFISTSDLHADATYRRGLVKVLTERVLAAAFIRARN